MLRSFSATRAVVLALAIGAASAWGQTPRFGPADPVEKDPAQFDTKRPVSGEMQSEVPDGFTVTAVGDLIISRPLSQYAGRLPAFAAVLEVLKRSDAALGNLETSIFDARHFSGSPYSWDGDWAVSSAPAVAGDLRRMGFGLVARANNHALDWGLEGMRETGRWLDEAGIVHAGAGDTHGMARAAQYVDGERGRVALVSLATSFRPTSESLPARGMAPGRPGISALHLTQVVGVPAQAMGPLTAARCALLGKQCGESPTEGELFGTKYRQAETFSHEHSMDPEDLAEIFRSIRAAQQNADFVVVAVHAHECSLGCDGENTPRGAASFLRQLAHDAIDSGADIFVTTGNHNLGPVEVYRSPARGFRPIFYGLGNFFWSDIQEPLPQDLFRRNRERLAKAWENPAAVTEYDLTAPLNAESFANAFTFQSVVAESRFEGGQLAQIVLHPIEEGYGSTLPASGIPRLVTDPILAKEIFGQITAQTAQFGLPALDISYTRATAVIRPGKE